MQGRGPCCQYAEMFRRVEVAKGNRRTFIVMNKTKIIFNKDKSEHKSAFALVWHVTVLGLTRPYLLSS